MLQNLLEILPGDGSNWAGQTKDPSNFYFNDMGEPFVYALIGFVVVFAGIALLIFIIWLFGLLMRKTNNLEFLTKKRVKKNKKSKVEEPKAEISESDEIPDEVKAAIVAAIMAYYQGKQEKCQFTVKRIRRIKE